MKLIKNLFKLTFFAVAVVLGMRIYQDKGKNIPTKPDLKKTKSKSKSNSNKQAATPKANKTVKVATGVESKLNSRQSKLLSLIRQAGKAEMSDLKTEFSSVTTRTLRRDLNKLEELDLVTKQGKTKSARYIAK